MDSFLNFGFSPHRPDFLQSLKIWEVSCSCCVYFSRLHSKLNWLFWCSNHIEVAFGKSEHWCCLESATWLLDFSDIDPLIVSETIYVAAVPACVRTFSATKFNRLSFLKTGGQQQDSTVPVRSKWFQTVQYWTISEKNEFCLITHISSVQWFLFFLKWKKLALSGRFLSC